MTAAATSSVEIPAVWREGLPFNSSLMGSEMYKKQVIKRVLKRKTNNNKANQLSLLRLC